MWDKDDEEQGEDDEEEFAEGDDDAELALDIFCHIIVR